MHQNAVGMAGTDAVSVKQAAEVMLTRDINNCVEKSCREFANVCLMMDVDFEQQDNAGRRDRLSCIFKGSRDPEQNRESRDVRMLIGKSGHGPSQRVKAQHHLQTGRQTAGHAQIADPSTEPHSGDEAWAGAEGEIPLMCINYSIPGSFRPIFTSLDPAIWAESAYLQAFDTLKHAASPS
jgi:hypothetical protein